MEPLPEAALRGPALAPLVQGAVSLEEGPDWLRPWRLQEGQRSLYEPALAAQAACAAVRLALRSGGTRLRLVAEAAKEVEGVDMATIERNAGFPAEYELFVDGKLFAKKCLGEDAMPQVVSFEGLPEGDDKLLELWLPPAIALDLKALDAGDAPARPPEDKRPLWLCYGSSICHGGPAQASPSGSWPGVCARLADVRLANLGFGGQCFVDQGVARAIRDSPCDCISLKLGINIQCLGALSERTFPAAVVGFVQTVRDGHPKTPLVIFSPIFSEPLEDRSPIQRPGFLSLVEMRRVLAGVVERFRKAGDENIFYRDGLELLGKAEAHLLYDGLHPGEAGHEVMGRRAAKLEFGPKGRLLQRLSEEAAAGIKEETKPGLCQEVLGAFVCEVPDGTKCRMLVGEMKGSLFCRSDRSDWPPSRLHTRGDLVFLRNTPGVWGKIEAGGRAVKFSNGIVWVRLPGGAQ